MVVVEVVETAVVEVNEIAVVDFPFECKLVYFFLVVVLEEFH